MHQDTRSDGRRTIAGAIRTLLAASLLLAALALAVAANLADGLKGSTPSPEQLNPSALSTVVILAETADAPGQSPLGRFQKLSAEINRYYALNAYGCVSFDFTFLDADGPAGTRDWYSLGPSLSAYPDAYSFVTAALARALAGADLPESLHLERAIVVYAGASQQVDETQPLYSTTLWLPSEHYIELQGPQHVTRLYVPNLVFVSEEDGLGVWVHELAHTLPAQYPGNDGTHIADRYDYQRGPKSGRMGYWDLMGYGCRWGEPESTSPTHMSSYTKVAANWLRYAQAPWGKEVMLTALENQALGDYVLTLDDPLSEDSLCYYIIEARDADVPLGAPESGVVIYHVTYDHEADQPVVDAESCQCAEEMGHTPTHAYLHSPLHGAADPEGAKEYVNAAAGFKVTLVAESFSPYRATIRIERYQAN